MCLLMGLSLSTDKRRISLLSVSYECFPHVEEVLWHFFEAEHGKGASDGIGGALKRTADRMVSQRRDIRSAK